MRSEVQKALDYFYQQQDQVMHLDDNYFQMKILLRAVEEMDEEIGQLMDDLLEVR